MRNTRFNGIVGSPGAGKSTYLANAIAIYRGNAIVFKHTINIEDAAFAALPQHTTDSYKHGKCKIAGTEDDYRQFLSWVKNYYRNGVLVIDDATIFEDGKLSVEMRHLVAMRRHYGIDIWLVYHGFSGFPIDQYKFINHLVIFNTNDEIGYKKNKIPQYQAIQAAIATARNRFATKRPNDRNRYIPEVVTLSM
jgi:hypothetical protein